MRKPSTPRSSQKRRVGPVEVRLLRREQVQVPLAVRHPGPRRAAERADPVVRRVLALRADAVAEDVAVALRAARLGRHRGLEPGVLVAGVVGHDVDGDLDVALVRLGQQHVEVAEGAEHRVDVARVGDVVAVVGHRGAVEGRQPQRVDAQQLQVTEPGVDAFQVSDAVTVRIGERAYVDLVEDGVLPPGFRSHQTKLFIMLWAAISR
jgi:hypothetical protein